MVLLIWQRDLGAALLFFGVFLAMLTFAFKQPPLVMFSLIIFFSLVAEITGDIAQLYLYRKGVRYG